MNDTLRRQLAELVDELDDQAPPISMTELRPSPRGTGPQGGKTTWFVVAASAVLLVAGLAAISASQPESRTRPASAPPQEADPTEGKSDLPSTAAGENEPEEPVALVVPPPEGEADTRTPVQRLIGVPVDPGEATAWGHDRSEVAIADCMKRRGHTYLPQWFDDSQVPSYVDPNSVIQEGLSADEFGQYRIDLYDGEMSCVTVGSNAVSALAGLERELDAEITQLRNTDRFKTTLIDYEECLAGSLPNSDDEQSRLRECGESTGMTEVGDWVQEQAELRLIENNPDHFLEFMRDLPTLPLTLGE